MPHYCVTRKKSTTSEPIPKSHRHHHEILDGPARTRSLDQASVPPCNGPNLHLYLHHLDPVPCPVSDQQTLLQSIRSCCQPILTATGQQQNAIQEFPLAVYHVCRICRRPRSDRYHREHPIPINCQLPPATVCRRCRKTVEKSTHNVEVTTEAVSNEVKIGVRSLVPDNAYISHQQMQTSKDAKIIASLPLHATGDKKSSPSKEVDKGDQVADWRDSITRSVLTLSASPALSGDTPTRDVAARLGEEDGAKSQTGVDQARIDNAADANNIVARAKTADKYQSDDIGSPELSKPVVLHTSPGDNVEKLSDDYIRNVCRDVVEKYRRAERKIANHRSPYAYGRLVPVDKNDQSARASIQNRDERISQEEFLMSGALPKSHSEAHVEGDVDIAKSVRHEYTNHVLPLSASTSISSDTGEMFDPSQVSSKHNISKHATKIVCKKRNRRERSFVQPESDTGHEEVPLSKVEGLSRLDDAFWRDHIESSTVNKAQDTLHLDHREESERRVHIERPSKRDVSDHSKASTAPFENTYSRANRKSVSNLDSITPFDSASNVIADSIQVAMNRRSSSAQELPSQVTGHNTMNELIVGKETAAGKFSTDRHPSVNARRSSATEEKSTSSSRVRFSDVTRATDVQRNATHLSRHTRSATRLPSGSQHAPRAVLDTLEEQSDRSSQLSTKVPSRTSRHSSVRAYGSGMEIDRLAVELQRQWDTYGGVVDFDPKHDLCKKKLPHDRDVRDERGAQRLSESRDDDKRERSQNTLRDEADVDGTGPYRPSRTASSDLTVERGSDVQRAGTWW